MIKCSSSFRSSITPTGQASDKTRGQALNQQPLRDAWRSMGGEDSTGKRRSSWVSGSGPLLATQRAVVASGHRETRRDELKKATDKGKIIVALHSDRRETGDAYVDLIN